MQLKRGIRNFVQRTLARWGVVLVSSELLKKLYRSAEREERLDRAVALLRTVQPGQVPLFLEQLPNSKSQLLQDLFVLCQTNFKRDGFFVEFGATNGIDLSNTYLLETQFGWRGILAEPARRWRAALQANRRAALDFDCVWVRTGESLDFNETEEGELSTLEQFSAGDVHRQSRESGQRYRVQTISLLDLLDKYGAPDRIDYLSIDTEGSELDILSAFDFGRYRFDVITVEHNFTPSRERIHDLLTGRGYTRVLTELSAFDDWYVHG